MLFNIWVTTICNLKCTYCYEGQKKKTIKMDRDVADKIILFIIDKVNKLSDKYVVVNYHGGEPLLNFEIVRYITDQLMKKLFDRNLLFGITTNAVLLNRSITEYLTNNFKYNLSISIDGTPEIHDLNRKDFNGEGTYKKVVSNIYDLLSKRNDLRARITYNPDTIAYLANSIKHVEGLGFKNIVPVPDYSDNKWNDIHGKILEDQIDMLYTKYKNKSDIFISILNPDFYISKGRCNAGIGEINIDCVGDIYPCTCMVSDKAYKIGSVTKDIDYIIIKELLKKSMEKNLECNDCNLAHWCIGARCKLVNKMITGYYDLPPGFLCKETHAIYNSYHKNGGK